MPRRARGYNPDPSASDWLRNKRRGPRGARVRSLPKDLAQSASLVLRRPSFRLERRYMCDRMFFPGSNDCPLDFEAGSDRVPMKHSNRVERELVKVFAP